MLQMVFAFLSEKAWRKATRKLQIEKNKLMQHDDKSFLHDLNSRRIPTFEFFQHFALFHYSGQGLILIVALVILFLSLFVCFILIIHEL